MATVNLGRVSVVPRGAWAAGTAYSRLDVVSHEGSSYMARGAVSAGTPVSDAASWQLLASRGLSGGEATISADADNLIVLGSDDGLFLALTAGPGLTLVGSEIRHSIATLTRV